MVKITGPLTSNAASGSVGGAITFATWKGRPYVRELVKPKNPNSGKQLSNRLMLGFLSAQWSTFSPGEQASWISQASGKTVSPFNAFISENMQRWRSFQGGTIQYPATNDGTQSTLQPVTATGGTRMITLNPKFDDDEVSWILYIFRQLNAPVVPAFDNLVHVRRFDWENPPVFVDTPLAPGTYHYNFAGATSKGLFELINDPVSATATP